MPNDTKQIDKLTIDRRRWLRGEGGSNSALIRGRDGKMCCLGFLGLACGIPAKSMLGVGGPTGVAENDAKWPDYLSGRQRDTDLFIEANDNPMMSDSDRELRLFGLFARHGVAVEFIE